MNCNETKELFSLWLDNEMNEQERELFQFHMKQCASCRLELEQWKNISLVLQELGKKEISAPPDFNSAVMTIIHQDRTINAKPARWQWTKTAKSGIAAAIILLFTTLAINSTPLLQVADNSSPEKVKTHYAAPKKTNSNSVNPAEQVANVTAKSGTPAKEVPVNPNNGSGEQQIAAVPTKNPEARPVFLNKERFLTTVMLKLQVADPISVKTQAINMAKAAGAQTELLGQQNQDGSKFAILKITTSLDSSESLLNQLKALGTQISIQEERQELTARFSTSLEQYRSLLDQREKVQDKEQIARLDQQIASLQEQLTSWDKQVQEASIVLWLEE